MNKQQKEALKSYTCSILERYSDVDEYMELIGASIRIKRMMKKAFDLINEVNQYYVKNEQTTN